MIGSYFSASPRTSEGSASDHFVSDSRRRRSRTIHSAVQYSTVQYSTLQQYRRLTTVQMPSLAAGLVALVLLVTGPHLATQKSTTSR